MLLVTSRETQRWVIPKGWPWPEKTDVESVVGEAWEEAGISGSVEEVSFGRYRYLKRLGEGSALQVAVDVYILWVTDEQTEWPERAERRRLWCSIDKAVEAVEEPQLKALLHAVLDARRHR